MQGYVDNEHQSRTTIKHYDERFKIEVSGEATIEELKAAFEELSTAIGHMSSYKQCLPKDSPIELYLQADFLKCKISKI